MKKNILITLVLLLSISFLSPTQQIQAAHLTSPEIEEEDLEDSLLTLLMPKIEDEVEKHYGTSRLIDCWKVTHIKRLVSAESFFFEISIQFVTLGEQRKPPYDLMHLTFSNFPVEWKVTNKKVVNLREEQLSQYCE